MRGLYNMIISKKYLIVCICLLVSSIFSHAQKRYDLAYTQYSACKYNSYTGKYCSSKDEPIWKSGVVTIRLTQDSILYVNLNTKKTYRIKLNNIKTDYNSYNEEIVAFTGRSESSNYMLVVGPNYFNFLKIKDWGYYFEDKTPPKKQDLTSRNIGTINFAIKGTSTCMYNEKLKKYDEKDCSFKNLKKKKNVQVRTFTNRGRLFMQVDPLEEFEVVKVEDVEQEKNGKISMNIMYYGKNNTSVIIGKDFFDIVFPDYTIMTFSEKEYPKEWAQNSATIISGSSVAIAPDVIITNAHVIKDISTMALYVDGVEIKNNGYEVIGEPNELLDLAIIKVKGVNLKACPLSTKEPVLGEDVLVYGYPQIDRQGTDLKVTKGIVSGKNGFQGDKASFQIDAAIQHGNSGGPIVANNEIIGLATSFLLDAQNANSGIKSSKIYHLLQFYGIEPTPNTSDYEKCTYLIVGE